MVQLECLDKRRIYLSVTVLLMPTLNSTLELSSGCAWQICLLKDLLLNLLTFPPCHRGQCMEGHYRLCDTWMDQTVIISLVIFIRGPCFSYQAACWTDELRRLQLISLLLPQLLCVLLFVFVSANSYKSFLIWPLLGSTVSIFCTFSLIFSLFDQITG